MPAPALTTIDLPGIPKLRSGKVREVFDLGETLLFVTTDRLSAFDVILPDPIPGKGAVLNQISAFWFRKFREIDNHFVTENFDDFPEAAERIPRPVGGSIDDRAENESLTGRMRGARLPGRLGVEGVSAITKRVR